MDKKLKTLDLMKDIVLLTIATFIIAIAVFFFMMPSHAAISSVSGLAIVLTNFCGLSVATLTMIMNVTLLIVGIAIFGKEFGFKTIYTSIALPLFLAAFERIFPENQSLTGDAFLDVVCYCFVVSIGLAILFNDNASSGGLDIVAKLINKYLRIDIGKAMSIAGIVIALSSALVYDKKTVVLSVLGTYLNGIILDHIIFGQNIKKRVCIVSLIHEKQIREFILKNMHSGATLYDAIGAYQGEHHTEIITIVTKNEFRTLMDYISSVDPKAFVTVYTVSEIHYQPKPNIL